MTSQDRVLLIDTLYTGKKEIAASYLLYNNGESAFVETGANSAAPLLCEVLESKGLSKENVRYVFVSHIHLDHAGGAGTLLELFPNAKLVVHPRGAPHMVDPTRLIEGSRIAYGPEFFERYHGTVKAIPADRVVAATDGQEFLLGGDRRITVYHAPGHAPHHVVVFDHESRGVFTGDALGASYPSLRPAPPAEPRVFLQAVAPRLEPELWRGTLRRIGELQPTTVFLTHFGPIPFRQVLIDDALQFLDDLVALAPKDDTPFDAPRVAKAVRALLLPFFPASVAEDAALAEHVAHEVHMIAGGIHAYTAMLARKRQAAA